MKVFLSPTTIPKKRVFEIRHGIGPFESYPSAAPGSLAGACSQTSHTHGCSDGSSGNRWAGRVEGKELSVTNNLAPQVQIRSHGPQTRLTGAGSLCAVSPTLTSRDRPAEGNRRGPRGGGGATTFWRKADTRPRRRGAPNHFLGEGTVIVALWQIC